VFDLFIRGRHACKKMGSGGETGAWLGLFQFLVQERGVFRNWISMASIRNRRQKFERKAVELQISAFMGALELIVESGMLKHELPW